MVVCDGRPSVAARRSSWGEAAPLATFALHARLPGSSGSRPGGRSGTPRADDRPMLRHLRTTTTAGAGPWFLVFPLFWLTDRTRDLAVPPGRPAVAPPRRRPVRAGRDVRPRRDRRRRVPGPAGTSCRSGHAMSATGRHRRPVRTAAARAVEATKVYGSATPRSSPSTRSPSTSRPAASPPSWALGLGQVDPHALRGRARHPDRRPRLRGRRRPGHPVGHASSRCSAGTGVGFVFQAFNLVPTLTARENIVLPDRLAGRRADAAWFDEIVATVGLGDRLEHRPAELSGRPAAAGGRGPGAGRPARHRVRRRAHRQPRLPAGGRDPRLPAPGRRRPGPDRGHGHPRPGGSRVADRSSSWPTAGSSTTSTPPTAASVLDRMSSLGG